MRHTALITLGRYGDVLNALPIAHHLWLATGERPHFIVHAEFWNLLAAVSYVVPVIAPVPRVDQCELARAWAEQRYGRVLVAQTHGNRDQRRLMRNFAAEAYRLAGAPELYDGGDVVIDRRELRREEALWSRSTQHLDTTRPVIAFNLGGLSSPFRNAAQFHAQLSNAARDHGWELIDLAQIRALRLHDLLGILDRVDALITTDTSTLHLARASRVPTIELVNDTPWLASDTGPRSLMRTPYAKAGDSVAAITARIESQLSAC